MKKLGLVPDHAVPHDVVVIDREKPKKGQGDDWDSLPEDEKKFSSRTMEVYPGMVERMDYNIGNSHRVLGKDGRA